MFMLIAFFGIVLSTLSAWDYQHAGEPLMRIRQVKLFDQNGFENPILSRTFLLPKEWEVQGGVQWNTGGDPSKDAFFESFSAVSPDRLASFEMLPNYSWVCYSDPTQRALLLQAGMKLHDPLDASGVIREYILPNYRSGATIRWVTPKPELSKRVLDQMRSTGLNTLEASGNRIGIEFVEARIAYEIRGIPYEEIVVVQLLHANFSSTRTQMFTASNMFLFRAPSESFDEHAPIYLTAMRSMRQNPAWIKAITQYQRRVADINMQGALRRQQIMHQMYQEIAKNNQETWERRQDSLDRVTREVSESIRGVETYNDPSTGYDVELPSDYSYAYSNGLGEYIVTNDPSFQPEQLNGNWQSLKAIR